MYTKYFGFNEKPFTLTPNPRFIYLSKHHKEAFAHLLYGINNHYGFIELIGEVGTGKTTVLRTLLAQLQEENYRTALVFNPCLSGVELLRTINHEFGLPAQSNYTNDLLTELNHFLLDETEKGHTVVLVIDEAQNLQPEVLEQIRLISNLETANDKLIQIILAGQPELAGLLERPDLRQLNQRIAIRYRLTSMSMNETKDYIHHRMQIAGYSGGVTFGYYAIKWIHLYTRGVPRMINILCDRALLIAYADEKRRITASIVSRGIKEILNLPQNRRQRSLLMATCIILLFVVIAVGIYMRQNGYSLKIKNDKPALALTNKQDATSQKIEPVNQQKQTDGKLPLQQELLTYNQQDFHIKAFNAIAERWQERPIKIFGGKLIVPDKYRKLALKRNLRVTEFTSSLEQALSFNLPFLAATNVKGELGNYCIAITGQIGSDLTIAPTLSNKSQIYIEQIRQILSGRYYVVWKNNGQIPDNINPGEARYEIRTLQQLLKNSGTYNDRIDGVYSDSTIKAVTAFQHLYGIPENKRLGELTLAALSKFDTSRPIPVLKKD